MQSSDNPATPLDPPRPYSATRSPPAPHAEQLEARRQNLARDTGPPKPDPAMLERFRKEKY